MCTSWIRVVVSIAAKDVDAGIVSTAQKYAPLLCVAPRTTT
jgi:hypothetical protein